MAAPDVAHLNWGSQVNPGQCPAGKLVINVSQRVINSLDSGTGGNWWAADNYERQNPSAADRNRHFLRRSPLSRRLHHLCRPQPPRH